MHGLDFVQQVRRSPAIFDTPLLVVSDADATAAFEVEIKELRVKELPPLDDDFARDHGKCDSLAELRARVRADLERQARSRADDAVREQIVEQILARHPFDVPVSLVERRTEALVTSFESGLAPGTNREEARATLRERLRPRAAQQVQVELLLDAVAERERIVVSEDEVSAEIDAIAMREQQVPERMRALYDRPEARAALRARLARDRALAGLVSSVGSSSAASPMPPSAAESVAHEK
jgi:trigger factor